MSGQRSRQNGDRSKGTTGGGKTTKDGKNTKDIDFDDLEIDEEDLEALQKRMIPTAEEPGIGLDDDDEYARYMGKT